MGGPGRRHLPRHRWLHVSGLISSGRDSVGRRFVDASESGARRLLPHLRLAGRSKGPRLRRHLRRPYRRRLNRARQTDPCKGDACVPLPAAPEDPTVGSLIPGPGKRRCTFRKTHSCPKGKRGQSGKARCGRQASRPAEHHSDRKRGLDERLYRSPVAVLIALSALSGAIPRPRAGAGPTSASCRAPKASISLS